MATKALPGPSGAPEEDRQQGGPNRTARTLVILLVILNVAAAGAFAWLHLVKLKGLDRNLKSSQRTALSVRQQLYDLRATVNTISGKKLKPIDEPTTLIMKIAEQMDLRGKVRAEKAVRRRWRDTNYEEVSVRVSFIEKEGFHFEGLIRFMEAIEKANPKLLIREMNFGKRDSPGQLETDSLGEIDLWRPTGAALQVRTFALKSTAR